MKKTYYKYISLIFVLILFLTKAQSQSLSIDSYGTWDRGGDVIDFNDPNFDFVLGIEATSNWKEVNPSRGVFDFSFFQGELDKAFKNNKLIRFSVNVGPSAPNWIYDKDSNPANNPYPQIQKVTTSGGNDKDQFPFYPEYLSQIYKDYSYKLIEAFSIFLRNQPEAKFKLIAFVQVKTGCTGDEAPYKGILDDNKYIISSTDWDNFRNETFAQYKKYFNDVTDRKIVLTFNDVDPEVEALNWNWVRDNIDNSIGFGIKGGAYNRMHHLNDEKSFKETWVPYLVNPKISTANTKGLKLFSASEMDGVWQGGVFAINPDLGFYWGVMSGLNVGLSTYNLNGSSMKFVSNSPVSRETFRMYNRYAKQVYPQTATIGWCVFHEGLNAADAKKFPMNEYENQPVSRSNIGRYLAICNSAKYKSRGAQMDDLGTYITGGFSNQRSGLQAFNDAGWDIAEGNYERFFTQIKPDNTSIGLFRVRGTIDANSAIYDRFARSFENATGKNVMYFKFDKEVFTNSIPKSLQFKIIWLDKTAGSTWAFKYRSAQGIKEAKRVTGQGDNIWKEVTFTITDAIVDGKGVNGSDCTLENTDTVDDIFNGIEVSIERTTLSVNSNTILPTDFIAFFKQNEFTANINSNTNSKGSIKIFTINGSLILSEDIMLKVGNNAFLKELTVPSGIYIVALKSDGQLVSHKLIKN
jgi:hypothetical protein